MDNYYCELVQPLEDQVSSVLNHALTQKYMNYAPLSGCKDEPCTHDEYYRPEAKLELKRKDCDASFNCHELARIKGKPVKELVSELLIVMKEEIKRWALVDEVFAKGSYINFVINGRQLAHNVFMNMDLEYARNHLSTHKSLWLIPEEC